MKPLELHIYEKHPDADAYRVGGFYSPYCLVFADKRFQQGELAAEYWKVMAGLYDGHGKSSRARRETLERFLTFPHYDEADQ